MILTFFGVENALCGCLRAVIDRFIIFVAVLGLKMG